MVRDKTVLSSDEGLPASRNAGTIQLTSNSGVVERNWRTFCWAESNDVARGIGQQRSS